jgi:membrane protease YdiL (CAAX protease family)
MTTGTAPDRGIRAFARQHPLTMFFALAYGVTWLLWAPVVLLGIPAFDPVRHAPSPYALPGVAIGVSGSAFLMVALVDGRAGVRRMLARLVSWRHGLQWYLVAILLLPMAGILTALVLGQTQAGAALAVSALVTYPAAYIAHFFFGPLFEESGWRGFALPRMQHRFGPLLGSFYLSLLWAGWHVFLYSPMWLADGSVAYFVGQAGFFLLFVVAMTFTFTWLSNNTQASLLLVILLHGSVDGTSTYMQRLAADGAMSPEAASTAIGLGALIGYAVVMLILLVTTRGKLGYPRYRREAEALDLHPAGAIEETRRA